MNTIRKIVSNAIGWRTKRKLVVIESDDWGSIRTRSKPDFDAMLEKGLNVDGSNFTRFDSLECNMDLENLFTVLNQHKDSNGRPAVFTPMCILANPDFKKIKDSSFSQYYYESIEETCKRYPSHDRLIDLWKQGASEKLFIPALHGREHLSVSRWMKQLKDGNKGLLTAFEHESFGAFKFKDEIIDEYLGAFHPDHSTEIPELIRIAEESAAMFEKYCGYKATHFIAPNREGPIELDKALFDLGVNYLTLSKLRRYPLGDDKYKFDFNWMGKKNRIGQVIITRNCHFEPSDSLNYDWVGHCMKEIETAFICKKPAIVSSHRVNFVGFVNKQNADRGLKELGILLQNIVKKWPNVEFMTSSELGEIMK